MTEQQTSLMVSWWGRLIVDELPPPARSPAQFERWQRGLERPVSDYRPDAMRRWLAQLEVAR